MNKTYDSQLTIKQLETQAETEICARMRASSEPWITLKRDYDAALSTITHPGREVYLGLIDDKIVGFILITLHGVLTGCVLNLCVDAKWRGQKIGAQLLDFAENRVFEKSPNVFLLVSAFNTKAQNFYSRLGYKKVGDLENYVIAGYSEFIFRKTIGPRNDFYSPQKH